MTAACRLFLLNRPGNRAIPDFRPDRAVAHRGVRCDRDITEISGSCTPSVEGVPVQIKRDAHTAFDRQHCRGVDIGTEPDAHISRSIVERRFQVCTCGYLTDSGARRDLAPAKQRNMPHLGRQSSPDHSQRHDTGGDPFDCFSFHVFLPVRFVDFSAILKAADHQPLFVGG